MYVFNVAHIMWRFGANSPHGSSRIRGLRLGSVTFVPKLVTFAPRIAKVSDFAPAAMVQLMVVQEAADELDFSVPGTWDEQRPASWPRRLPNCPLPSWPILHCLEARRVGSFAQRSLLCSSCWLMDGWTS